MATLMQRDKNIYLKICNYWNNFVIALLRSFKTFTMFFVGFVGAERVVYLVLEKEKE